jgi:phosphoglycerate kinase
MKKNILFRADLDVPLINGRVANNYRLQCLLPSLLASLKTAQKLLIIGHQGRPARRGGPTQINTKDSLIPVRDELEKLIHQPISFIPKPAGVGEWQKKGSKLALLENLRFFPGENGLDREFAHQITQGSDFYIYEAFAHFHPSSSLQIIPEILPTKTGKRFNLEVKTLTQIIKNPRRPSLLILSGAKQDKFKIVENLQNTFNSIIIGGHLASLNLPPHLKSLSNIKTATLSSNGLDIDKNAIMLIQSHILKAKTIVLNGPLGRFEDGINTQGTKEILKALKNSPAFTLLGGGDTLNAIKTLGFNYTDFSFVSTGGGAMLNFFTTGTHPLLSAIFKS